MTFEFSLVVNIVCYLCAIIFDKMCECLPTRFIGCNQETQAESHDPGEKLRDQMTQLCQTMTCGSPVQAIRLWNSWYLVPGTGGNSFRTVDPNLADAVGLFLTYMSILTTQANWSFQVDTTSDQVASVSKQAIIRQIRSWLDDLATSRWGELCPGKFFSFFRTPLIESFKLFPVPPPL